MRIALLHGSRKKARVVQSNPAGLLHSGELFYMDKTMMVFGDAEKVIEDTVKAVE